MTGDLAPLVPELGCVDLARSLAFYVDVLGWRVLYQRPEQHFAYLEREGAQVMLEQKQATLPPPGLPRDATTHLQIAVSDVDALRARLAAAAVDPFREIEERWYRRDGLLLGLRQFYVMDPDGYLLRFVQGIGTRPT